MNEPSQVLRGSPFGRVLGSRGLARASDRGKRRGKVEEAILRLSRSRCVFASLAFAISAFVMLYDGLRLPVSNWRLTLVQILAAMWIWLAMFDLKAHTLHGQSFNVLRGPVLIPLGRPWFLARHHRDVMMVSYVAVPARLIGAEKREQSTRDKCQRARGGR